MLARKFKINYLIDERPMLHYLCFYTILIAGVISARNTLIFSRKVSNNIFRIHIPIKPNFGASSTEYKATLSRSLTENQSFRSRNVEFSVTVSIYYRCSNMTNWAIIIAGKDMKRVIPNLKFQNSNTWPHT